jgi:hypothetical protein
MEEELWGAEPLGMQEGPEGEESERLSCQSAQLHVDDWLVCGVGTYCLVSNSCRRMALDRIISESIG